MTGVNGVSLPGPESIWEAQMVNPTLDGDGATELMPHQIESHHVQGDGGSVMFWNLITAEEPRYSSTFTERNVNTGVYIDILQTSLLDTLEYYNKLDRKSFRF
jgi:hypothetical protein